MSVPSGCAASNSIDERRQINENQPPQPPAAARRSRWRYLRELAARREAAAIGQQTVYGLVMGWVLALVGGFVFYCVPSRFDWLWCAMLLLGLVHLAAAVALPQVLYWPERGWIAVARWQGWLIMTLLLTVIYYGLIWPAGRLSRGRIRGFYTWDGEPPPLATAWQRIDPRETDASPLAHAGRRSLPMLLLAIVGFFIRRGNYLVVPIIILLVVLGLVLYFVQSSALAPFIYTLF